MDVVALLTLLAAGLALAMQVYSAGYASGSVGARGTPSFRILALAGLAGVGVIASFAWVSGRLVLLASRSAQSRG